MIPPTEMQLAVAIDDAWRHAALPIEEQELYLNPADLLELCGNGALVRYLQMEFRLGIYGVPMKPDGNLERGQYEVRRVRMALADATGVP